MLQITTMKYNTNKKQDRNTQWKRDKKKETKSDQNQQIEIEQDHGLFSEITELEIK